MPLITNQTVHHYRGLGPAEPGTGSEGQTRIRF